MGLEDSVALSPPSQRVCTPSRLVSKPDPSVVVETGETGLPFLPALPGPPAGKHADGQRYRPEPAGLAYRLPLVESSTPGSHEAEGCANQGGRHEGIGRGSQAGAEGEGT